MRSSPHVDPAWGLFETLLVLDGEAVEIDAHVGRLTDSLATLYGAELPADAKDAIAESARCFQRGRLRLTALPSEAGPVQIAVSTARIDKAEVFPSPKRSIALRSFVVEGGLGPHKWADRRLIDRYDAAAAAGEVPLLLDADGEVLEASRANVFAVCDGVLLTPRADGRIVPGIARRRTLELARAAGRDAREVRLSLDDLLAADEVFLTNSIRGIESVRSIDDRDVPEVRGHYGHSKYVTSSGGRGAGVEIATALRRHWLPVPRAGSVAVVAGGRRAGRLAR